MTVEVTHTGKVVWLNLTEDVQVAVPRDEALQLNRRGFARLYRQHVAGATRHEARQWADRQIALRDSVLAAQARLAAR